MKHRSDTDIFLVGQPEKIKACSSLPTNREVLRDYFARRIEFVPSGKLLTGSQTYETVKDTISAVLLFWNKAQIPQITQSGCEIKLKNLVKGWQGLMKHKSRNSQTELQKREKYGVFLEKLFDISARDWEQKIRSS